MKNKLDEKKLIQNKINFEDFEKSNSQELLKLIENKKTSLKTKDKIQQILASRGIYIDLYEE